jgi:integrase
MTTTTNTSQPQAGKLYTGTEIKLLKPQAKPYAARFGNGLYLWVTPTGTKSWRVNYHVDGKHQIATLGRWPDVSVSDAKAKRAAIREDIRTGGDPSVALRQLRAARQEAGAATVQAMSEAWIEAASRKWSANYRRNVPGRMAKHVYPAIGDLPIASVSKESIKTLLNTIGTTAPSMAVHIQQHLAGVFDYAVDHDKLTVNPIRQLRRWLPTRDFASVDKRAHVSTIEDARRVLQLVESSDSHPGLILGHRLLALTGLRKTEALGARWSEFNDDLSVWTIPASRMKGKQQHVVPLAPQAADVVRVARALQAATGKRSDYVFPTHHTARRVPRLVGVRDYAAEHARRVAARTASPLDRCVDSTAINKVMDRALAKGGMANAHTPHGWRYTFSTLTNESDIRLQHLVEVALAHSTKTRIGRIYDESQHVEARRVIACTWADRLLVGATSPWSLVGLRRPRTAVVELKEAA